MARSKTEKAEALEREIRGAQLEPVKMVRRALISPDGTRVEVDVPVYPPFRLKSDKERQATGT